MRIDPAGWPFIAGSLALAVAAELVFGHIVAGAFAILAAVFLFFFRDPNRPITPDQDAILAPADGRVMVAGAPAGQASPSGSWQQISIFLSPMDVHVNRMPIGGRVTKVEYHPGRFLPAYRTEAGDLNEYTEVTIDHDGQPIVELEDRMRDSDLLDQRGYRNRFRGRRRGERRRRQQGCGGKKCKAALEAHGVSGWVRR